MTDIVFTAPPTCAAMMRSDAFTRIIAGPVGSGKTTAVLFELFRRACEQTPAPDGLRYTRFAILRQTLAQLKQTVLKDILGWVGNVATYKVSDSTVFIEAGDVRSEWILLPLEDLTDQRRLLSSQYTGAWVSEGIEIDSELLPAIAGRCGRYPSANMGGATWMGIIIDTNMPQEGSPWHKLMAEPGPDCQVFIQPSGLSPNAENLNFLTQSSETLKLPVDHPIRIAQGRKYYQRLVDSYGENSPWCQRYVRAEFGPDPSGTSVFRESFKRSFHVVDKLEPVVGHPLMVGQDFGRDPCSVICQLDHKGRLLVLQEVMAEDIGLELHVSHALRPALIDPRYIGRPVCVVGDPSGKAKSSTFESSSFDDLKRMGFMAYPAPTNDIDPRLRAVEAFLLAQRDGGAAILIDGPRCPTLVRAFGGGYRYAKTKAGQRKPLPDKNWASHIMDALQYVCLIAHGGMGEMVARHIGRRKKAAKPKMSAAAWT